MIHLLYRYKTKNLLINVYKNKVIFTKFFEFLSIFCMVTSSFIVWHYNLLIITLIEEVQRHNDFFSELKCFEIFAFLENDLNTISIKGRFDRPDGAILHEKLYVCGIRMLVHT